MSNGQTLSERLVALTASVEAAAQHANNMEKRHTIEQAKRDSPVLNTCVVLDKYVFMDLLNSARGVLA